MITELPKAAVWRHMIIGGAPDRTGAPGDHRKMALQIGVPAAGPGSFLQSRV
jgi:hypothetical protein